jgi:hypothetical protein
LHVRRGQERFVDVEFRHRELLRTRTRLIHRWFAAASAKCGFRSRRRCPMAGFIPEGRDRGSGRAGSHSCSRSVWLAGNS